MSFGELAIRAAVVLALVAFVAAYRWNRGSNASARIFRWAYHGLTLALVAASARLMLAILNHDFRFDYVVGYTSRDLPLLYQISAFWAGQAGTYLLWALFGALVGYALCHARAWEPAAVMLGYLPTIGFMLVLMLDPHGNPFRQLSSVPADGRGLNPLLQDPWMASHPPLVFLGYVAMTVPAVLALVALFKRQEERWVAPALRWSLAAFVLLGAGIVLGGFWAYKVLGWGGYWGWDPVENASLIPWLVSAALIHALLVRRAAGALRLTSLALALSGYVLVLYATFLTRSGVLADFSVHSFPAGSIYRILLGILLLALGLSVFALLRDRGPAGRPVPPAWTWGFVLSSAIVLLGLSAALVLLGTSWPILSGWLGKPAAMAIPFYNQSNLPIYLILLALLGLAPSLAWVAPAGRNWLRGVLVAVGLALGGTLVAFVAGGRGFAALALFFVALVALAANAIRLWRVARGGWLAVGAPLAHAGFALLFLGIVASGSWGETQQVRLALERPVDALGRAITFHGQVDGSAPRDRFRLTVQRGSGAPRAAEVAMFTLDAERGSMMHEPAIVRGLTGDLYIAPLAVESGAEASRTLRLVRETPWSEGDMTVSFLTLQTEMMGSGQGMTVSALVEVRTPAGAERLALPLQAIDGRLAGVPVQLDSHPGRWLTLERMSVEERWIELRLVDRRPAGAGPTLVVEASTKPLIGLLWTGTLLLGLGCTVALLRRLREARAAVEVRGAAQRQASRRGRNAHAARVARAG